MHYYSIILYYFISLLFLNFMFDAFLFATFIRYIMFHMKYIRSIAWENNRGYKEIIKIIEKIWQNDILMIKWKIVAKWLKKAYALNNNQKIIKTVLRFLDSSLLLQHKIFIHNFLITQYVSEIKIANPYEYIPFILSREKIVRSRIRF